VLVQSRTTCLVVLTDKISTQGSPTIAQHLAQKLPDLVKPNHLWRKKQTETFALSQFGLREFLIF